MRIKSLLARLRRLDIELWVDDGKLKFSAPTGALTQEFKGEIVAQKEAIIAFLSDAARDNGHDLPPMKKSDRASDLPLSFAQNRMWFLYQLAPNSSYYNLPSALMLKGVIDIDVLEKVFLEIVRRHEIIRTVYQEREGEVRQIINESPQNILSVEDCSRIEMDEQEEFIREYIHRESNKPFDLARDLMLRVKVLRLHHEKHVVIFTMHHIASDGWSLGVLIKEIAELYLTYCKSEETRTPDLKYQYADYALWQREILSGERLDRHLSYWKRQLESFSDLELPIDRRRSGEHKRTGGRYSFQINQEMYYVIRDFCREYTLTPFMITLGVYHLLLSRYAGVKGFCVGTPIAGRRTTDLEGLIGFFVNSLPLRISYDQNETFKDYMKSVKANCLHAFAHQDMPFDLLVEKLQIERDFTKNPIFQTMFSFRAEQRKELSIPGLEIEQLGSNIGQAKFDLMLTVVESRKGLRCHFEYDVDIFAEDTLRRLSEDYKTILVNAVTSPEKQISNLLSVSEKDRKTVLHEWNETDIDYTRESLVHEEFSKVAREQSDRIALVLDGTVLSYTQLEERSNQLAHYLKAKEVSSQSLVGLSLERSCETIIGLLAILKVGCAYVPLDPAYPMQRLKFILEDTGLETIITHSELRESFPAEQGVQFICLDKEGAAIRVKPARAVDTASISSDSLAYVMYTSGSTGIPKGVAVTHKNVLRTALCPNYCTLDREQTLFHFAPLAFDASTFEIWGALLNGARLVICPAGPKSLEEISDQVLRHGVTTLFLTSGLYHKMVEERIECFSGLRQFLSGGDALLRNKVEKTLRTYPNLRVINAYGPTENTTITACCRLSSAAELTTQVPIGRPVSNTKIYILDDELNPVPIGAIGELYTSGDGVAREYWKRPGLTAGRFLPNPFGGNPGARMYRTGDLARWLPDGRIEFYGRRDSQVKIRGHRIELGEIESQLLQYSGIKQCAVVALEDGYGEKRLVGYIVPAGGEVSASAVRSFIEQSLPNYMVPSVIMELDSLPLTAHGKLNRRALPAPDLDAITTAGEFVEPASATEKRLVQIWKDVLHVEKISTQADFFSIGGHSLLATQVVSRIRSEFNLELPLRVLFEAPTISTLASQVDDSENRSELSKIEKASRDEPLPLSFAQQRMWFLNQLEPTGSAYNMAFGLRLQGELDIIALKKSIEIILARHEVARTTYRVVDERTFQHIESASSFNLEIIDIGEVPQEEREGKITSLSRENALSPFDLERGPIFRARVLVIHPQEHILFVAMHHIASDGWSMGIIVREFAESYLAFSSGAHPSLPELTIQYADFSLWQKQFLQGGVLEKQVNFWRENLRGVEDLELPIDYPRPALLSTRGDRVRISIQEAMTQRLREMASRLDSTLYMILLSAFEVLVYRYSGQLDFCVGTPIAGRNRKEIESLIGFFVNTLVLRSDIGSDMNFEQLVLAVRARSLDAHAHQDLPFEKLVDELGVKRQTSRTPLFQTMFALQNAPKHRFELPGLSMEFVPSKRQSSQFELSLDLVEDEKTLYGTLEYSTDLFRKETAERLCEHYINILQQVTTSPKAKLFDISFIDQKDWQCIQAWQSGPNAQQYDETIAALFAKQVQKSPNSIAIRHEEETISYGKLDSQSTHLALLLKERGVSIEDRVGLLLPRSIEYISSLFAVFKAGACYVPLDADAPQGRIGSICAEAKLSCVITNESLIDRLPDTRAALSLDRVDLEGFGNIAGDHHSLAQLENIAYVVFTSGSTGTPKGVAINHRSLVNHALSMITLYELKSTDKVLQFASLNFDVAAEEIFPTLLCGGTLVLRPEKMISSTGTFLETCEKESISVLNLPSTYWHEFISDGRVLASEWPKCIRLLILGSSVVATNDLKIWMAEAGRSIRTLNAYGPTETTITATLWEATEESHTHGHSAPIGKPISGVRTYVLDGNLRPTAVGIPGELYIGGNTVARSYIEDPIMTANSFLPDPYSDSPGMRMYRTGDLVRWTEDGCLEFLGRRDDQIKLRGYRIEIGEIEAQLCTHDHVRQAAVRLFDESPKEKYLIAYFTVQNQVVSGEDLRKYLRYRIPEYMIPLAFVQMEELPTTSSGKINRKALPKPDLPDVRKTEDFVPPQTSKEQAIASIWCDILNLKKISIMADFFACGGNSLLATQVVSRIRRDLGVELPLRSLFENTTIALMAKSIEEIASGRKQDDEDQHELLKKDVVLEPGLFDFQRKAGIATRPMKKQTVLLTGATGFLGVFLLEELLNSTETNIICLVRGQEDEEAFRRLEQQISFYKGEATLDTKRMRVIQGDLSKPRLGISKELFVELSNTLDIIIHNGALVNTLYPYSTLRLPNVQGTLECIRLAAFKRIPLFHISTASVLTSMQKLNLDQHNENWRKFAIPQGGYGQSKWAAEILLLQAHNQGLPVTIFRPGRLVGHSKTGAVNGQDLLIQGISSCIDIGTTPKMQLNIDMLPVDTAARMIIEKCIARNSMKESTIYSLEPSTFLKWNDIVVSLNAAGYRMKILAPDAMMEQYHSGTGKEKEKLELLSAIITGGVKHGPSKRENIFEKPKTMNLSKLPIRALEEKENKTIQEGDIVRWFEFLDEKRNKK